VWYDRRAHKRSFSPGDEVLVLLPILGHPLQARYSGPYVIEDKVNDLNFVVQIPEQWVVPYKCAKSILYIVHPKCLQIRTCDSICQSRRL